MLCNIAVNATGFVQPVTRWPSTLHSTPREPVLARSDPAKRYIHCLSQYLHGPPSSKFPEYCVLSTSSNNSFVKYRPPCSLDALEMCPVVRQSHS